MAGVRYCVWGVNVFSVRKPSTETERVFRFVIFWIILGAIPAIGAMGVVGMMLRDYGICSLLP